MRKKKRANIAKNNKNLKNVKFVKGSGKNANDLIDFEGKKVKHDTYKNVKDNAPELKTFEQDYDDIPIGLDIDAEVSSANADKAKYDSIKELFSDSKVATKTELQNNEIKLLTRIMSISLLSDFKDYDKLINAYMTLKISLNRQSRKEYVESLRNAEVDSNKQILNSFGKLISK